MLSPLVLALLLCLEHLSLSVTPTLTLLCFGSQLSFRKPFLTPELKVSSVFL